MCRYRVCEAKVEFLFVLHCIISEYIHDLVCSAGSETLPRRLERGETRSTGSASTLCPAPAYTLFGLRGLGTCRTNGGSSLPASSLSRISRSISSSSAFITSYCCLKKVPSAAPARSASVNAKNASSSFSDHSAVLVAQRSRYAGNAPGMYLDRKLARRERAALLTGRAHRSERAASCT